MGSARAPRAVFRALAENLERTKKSEPLKATSRKEVGRAARPATPGGGVLPHFVFRVKAFPGFWLSGFRQKNG